MELSQARVRDRPGRYGGALSSRLELTVEDVTDPDAPLRVYRGQLGKLGARRLEPLATRESRTYRFTVLFRDGGVAASPTTGDNAYQGSSVAVDFRWSGSVAGR